MHQGKKARELREASGMRQHEVAAALTELGKRTSQPGVCQIEERETLDGHLIELLARVFHASPMVFFEEPPLPRESREAAIDRALEYIRRDPALGIGAIGIENWPSEAKLAVVRVYERCRNTRLLPEGME